MASTPLKLSRGLYRSVEELAHGKLAIGDRREFGGDDYKPPAIVYGHGPVPALTPGLDDLQQGRIDRDPRRNLHAHILSRLERPRTIL